MKQLLIGTNNPSKLRIIRSYLADLPLKCVSPAELNLNDIPAEDARDASGNAVQKAQAWHAASGLPVITEDSGLVFLDLPMDHPDQPGVTVRRVNGRLMDDDEMLAYYQEIVRKHGGKLRFAWQDAWCVLIDANHYDVHVDTLQSLERHARTMVDVPCEQRLPGWPIDSLTYLPHLGKYKAELTIENMNDLMEVNTQAVQEDRAKLIAWLQLQLQPITA